MRICEKNFSPFSQSKYLNCDIKLARPCIFEHKMEVALVLKSYSFYNSSEIVYIKGQVLIKKDLEAPANCEHFFEKIKPGSKINCQFAFSNPEEIRLLHTERIVKLKTQAVSIPEDPKYSVSFIAQEIIKCEI